MADEELNAVFYNYPIFRFGRKIGFVFRKSIVFQSIFITVISIILILTGSLIDQTLILKGKDVGLLEHPTIWCFLLIQLVTPIYLKKAIGELLSFLKKNDIINSQKDLTGYISLFKKQTSRQMNFSKFSYLILISIGLICFVWNSFQNQSPLKFLGFDFWDSVNHPFGYWITRFYKFYLWLFLLPTIIHMQISILFVLYRLLKDAAKEKLFTLKPYNQDEHAGIGIIIKISIAPPIPILLLGSLSVLCAFLVHGQIETTPVIGLSLLSLLFLLVYLIPAIQLRKIIKAEKKRQLTEITEKQNSLYFTLINKKKDQDESNILETLNSLTAVFDQIKSISSWPYWKFMVKIMAVINIPVIISIGKNLWPAINSILQK